MEARSHILSPSVARGIAVMCAAVFIASAHAAQAGVNVWTSQGPPGGDVRALAIDPNTPQTLYAGTFGAGVFKSTDAGAPWISANAGLPSPDAYVRALAIDPNTPRTLYAGASGDGVFKSTDGGGTWNAANTGLPDTPFVSALAIDPNTPRTLYAGGSGGVFKSTDAGATWGGANAGLTYPYVSAVAIDPNTPRTLYAGAGTGGCDAGGNCPGGVFQSTDAGATWSATGLPSHFVRALAIAPTTPRTLYAGTGEAYDSGGVFKSTDGGDTWGVANTGLPSPYRYVHALAIDPSTPRILYAATQGAGAGVFKSTDAGSTWNALNTGLTDTFVDALAIDPMEPRRVYAGTNSGGVFAIEQISACVGDCSGTDTVAVNDIITLVNIALGTTQPSACGNGGLPLGGEVDVAVIIQAVNNALNGCGVGT